MSVAAYSTVTDTATPAWIPPRRPPAWLAVIPFGPHAGLTLGQVARRDPAHVYELADRAPAPELRAAARSVRGFIGTGVAR